MAFQIKDRVQETTTTTGTGTLNLAGAVDSFQTFVAGVGDGNTTYYAITDGNGSAWEVGIGTVTDASPDTLARTTVLGSSTGSKISLSSASHNVFVTYPADKAIFKDASGFVGIGTDSPTYELDVAGNVGVNEYIYHNDDADTYIRFQDDSINIYAGNRSMIKLDEGSTDKVIINNGTQDVDLQVKGDNDSNLIRTDAANDLVGIGTSSPSYKLDVFGHDAWMQASGVRIGASGIHLSGTKITATATELNYVDGVTSAVQTQLDAKQASLTFGISNTNAVKVDSASAADDEYARFTANGLESRSTSEVLSDIGAQASIGGAASTVTSSDLTASRALVSNGSGKIAVSSTTSTELGYLDISTLGTAEASKALTLDSGKKFTGIKDGTFNQYDSWVYASGVKIGASGISMDGSVIKTVQTSAESFADNNSSLMTSAAIADKIEAYSYITATLTEEQVDDFVGGMIAGNTETGISVTYEDGDGTLDFVVSDTTVAGDSGSTGMTPGDTLTIAGGTNIATAMSGDTLTITGTDTNTTYTGGTNLTLDGTTFNVDDAFLKNNADDTTTGIITAKGLVVNHYDSWVHASGTHVGASGIRFSDGTVQKTAPTDTNTTYTGGTNLTLSGTTFNVDDAFLKNDASDTTTGTITAAGFTTTGTWTFDTSAGGTTGITNINVGSAFTDDDVTLMSAGAIKEKIEAYSYITATLTEEQVDDFVGGMVAGNTETGIAVTYQDGDGTLDFAVSDTTVAGDSGSTGITPGDTLTIAGGTNISTAMSGDTLTITGSSAVDGSGAAGYLAYWSDADTLTYDNNQLFWDASSNELGIGTATPGSSLDVSGSLGYKPFMISSAENEGDTDWVTIGANTYEIGSAVTYLVETGNTARTIELPDPASSIAGRTYTIKKIDSGTGTVTIQPYSSGSPPAGGYIDGDNSTIDDGTNILFVQYDTISATCAEGTTSDRYEWHIVQEKVHPHCAKLEQQSTQNISKSTITDVAMTHTIFSVGCLVADPTNDYIMITRKGKYLVSGYCRIDEMTVDSKYMYLEIVHYDHSATSDVRAAGVTQTPSANDEPGTTTTAILDLDVDDHVSLRILHNDSSSTVPTLSGGGTWERAFLWVQEIK